MNTRRFGRMGWQVSEVGHDMWGLGSWAGSEDSASLEALQRAVDLGCTFFDTAWAYGEGRSERLLGQLIEDNPETRLYSATKIPPKNKQWPSKRGSRLRDVFPPEYIRDYVYLSLDNLGVSTLDLVQFHVWEDDWADLEGWKRAIDNLKSEGLIDAVGISINRWEPWNGIMTVESGHIDSVQVIYNIFDQNPEDELFPACTEHDVAIIARVPFDEGTLTGMLTKESTWPEGDWRNLYFVPENLHASVDRAEALKELLPDDLNLAEMALRFILTNPDVATVIPGMRKLANVEANCGCSDKGGLNDLLMNQLRSHRWDRSPTEWSY